MFPNIVRRRGNGSVAGSGRTMRRQVPRVLLRGVFNESEKSKDRPADSGHTRSTNVAGYRGVNGR
jgi:hypothetical protein